MDSKTLILSKLEDLKDIYAQNEEKKWNLRALSIAINAIKKYEDPITSGTKLKELKGIGEKISKRIDEILTTGTLRELSNPINNDLDNLMAITGVGLVRAKKWISLGICTLDELKVAIEEKKIKSTHHIDVGIKYFNDFQKKIPKEEIDLLKNSLDILIKKIDENLIFEICGSYRREAKESGDIDILISHKNHKLNLEDQDYLKKIVKILTKNKIIIDNLTTKGNTKFMGVCKIKEIARRIDIRFVHYLSYIPSLLYFTGSKNFNVYVRNKALENNYTLNEYSLTNKEDSTQKILHSEKEIFDILNIPYLTPKERNME